LGGPPENRRRHRIAEAILYVVRSGCTWRQLPHDVPPWATVSVSQAVAGRWTVDRLHDTCGIGFAMAPDGPPIASPGSIDPQSVKAAVTVGWAAVATTQAGRSTAARGAGPNRGGALP
jgi:transposase